MRTLDCLKTLPLLLLSLGLAGCFSSSEDSTSLLTLNDGYIPVAGAAETGDLATDPVGPGDEVVLESGGSDPGAGEPVANPVSLTGAVVKGVVANAVITALAIDGDGTATLLDTITTDSLGAYSLALPDGFSGVVKLLVTASADPESPTLMRCDASPDCGMHPDNNSGDTNLDGVIDFGEFHPVGEEFALRAVVVVSGSGPRIVNVTPLSTLAADWAAEFPQGLDEQSVDAANAQAAALFGFALADLDQPLSDITDPLWINLASPRQVKLSLLMATFAQIASQYDINPQSIIEETSRWFVGQQGRLAEASDNPYEPSVAMFTNVSLVLAGVVEMPPATQEEVTLALDSALGALQSGVLSQPLTPIVTLESVLARLGPMGTQFDELLTITGLYDPVAVANAQVPYFSWLLTPENLQILPLAIETVAYALVGSALLDMPDMPSTVNIIDDGASTVTVDRAAATLRVLGYRHGQLSDITINLTGLRAGLTAKVLNYAIDGEVLNSVSAGDIAGTLVIDLTGTDTTDLVAAVAVLLEGTPESGQMLLDAIHDLAYSMKVRVDVEGAAKLVRNTDVAQQLGINGALTGVLDLGAGETGEIGSLYIPRGEIFLPNGDRYYGRDGVPVLSVVMDDDATLVLDGAATLGSLNLPEATAHAEGTLTNSRALFVHIRDTLVDQFSVGIPELGALFGALLDFDITQLAIHGEGEILIPELDQQYRARLDNLTATLYQPYSDEVAASATVDIGGLGVDMRLGEDPWRLSLLSTPTPRLVLLGPSGQFAEATQEDLFSLLSALPLGELFAGLSPE